MPIPKEKPARATPPAWALKLKLRRLELGKGQEDIVAQSGDLMTQGWVSDLERGKVELPNAGFAKVVALARALGWTLPELQAETGVDLGIAPAAPLTATAPTPVYSLRALAAPDPRPDGLNLTPHPGPHPERWMQTFMEGDEMAPRIPDGFSAYFDPQRTAPERGIWVVRHAGRALIRRYSELPSGPAWTADHPDHALDFLPAGADVQVLGKVYRIVGVREAAALIH